MSMVIRAGALRTFTVNGSRPCVPITHRSTPSKSPTCTASTAAGPLTGICFGPVYVSRNLDPARSAPAACSIRICRTASPATGTSLSDGSACTGRSTYCTEYPGAPPSNSKTTRSNPSLVETRTAVSNARPATGVDTGDTPAPASEVRVLVDVGGVPAVVAVVGGTCVVVVAARDVEPPRQPALSKAADTTATPQIITPGRRIRRSYAAQGCS